MALSPDSIFGIYRIGEAIGEGGMGRVYRAVDTTLDRDVAIKVLPESFAADEDRVSRFEREAKTLASLNHPNIAQIYGLERQGDTTAIVMELVEGPTLAERISEGPIPADEALRIAGQIIEGLEAAHGKGIVHRDLKPANIKVRDDGSVKILDFGIAKPIELAGISGTKSPTMMTPAVTESGVIMGTAAYMSPEQARGKFVDQRTDIWAFGCVLYEMLTGQPAFGGEDVTVTLARVIERQTDVDSIPKTISPAVRQTLRLCLEKDPRQRIRHIGDVKLAMEGRFETATRAAGQESPARPLWQRLAVPAIAVVLTAAATLAVTADRSKAPPPPYVRRSIYVLPPTQTLNLPTTPMLGFAPDGNRYVYAVDGALYLRDLQELEGHIIPGTEGDSPIVPQFSPDGEWILYQSNTDNELVRVSVNGGTPVPVLNQTPSGGWVWSEDERILYADDCRIMEVPPGGGTPTMITQEDGYLCFEPTLIPGTELLLYERRSADAPDTGDVVIYDMGSGVRSVLFPGRQPLYVNTGHMVYFDTQLGLLARPFDLDTLEYGSPVSLADDISQMVGTGAIQYRISKNGSLVYIKGSAAGSEGANILGIADENGSISQLDAPPDNYSYPAMSPDGTQLAVQVGAASGANIFIYELNGDSERRQLTLEGSNINPVWTPDGAWITYASDRDGGWRIYRQRADGRGVAEALTEQYDSRLAEPAWAPDGRLAYTASAEGKGSDIWIARVPMGEPGVLVSGSGDQFGISFSADGKAMAYSSAEGSGASEVYVEPFPPDGSRVRVSVPGTTSGYPQWARDGNRLLYQVAPAGGGFTSVDIAVPGYAVRNRRDLPFTALPNVRRMDNIPGSDQWLMTVPPQLGDAGANNIAIVLVENWVEELKQRVPVD